MATVVREDQIDRAVDLLRQYQHAMTGDTGDLSPEESDIIRRHRIERAKLALENMGLTILPPLTALPIEPAVIRPGAEPEFGWTAGAGAVLIPAPAGERAA